MLDTLEEIERFSPFGGELIEENVLGANNTFVTAENSVYAEAGKDRTMYSYVPSSGCPDAKQCQVFMVLRNENTKESVETLMKELKLDQLAEERHFILLFPNPTDDGWNYEEDPKREDDLSFLVRCFAALPKSKGQVAGFNGMILYLGTTPQASALLQRLSLRKPLDASGIMVGGFPEGFNISEQAQPQAAWIYGGNTAYASYLEKTNAPIDASAEDHHNTINPNIRYFVTDHALCADEVADAWEKFFSETRRWRNDTYGTYQKRTSFSEWGFTAHVKDSSLGVNDGFAHTWYEYVPKKVKEMKEPVPLVFYFHGGNCIPLYGAEQSDWHVLAKRDNFIVVYPRASVGKAWNVWNDETGPSDIAFVLALIEHMKSVHPIDTSRVYVSGFSMGSMMTNALCCAYPDVFAGGAAFNAQNLGYFGTRSVLKSVLASAKSVESDEGPSWTKKMSDEKKQNYDYRIPLIQGAGLMDTLGTAWPIADPENLWLQTINFWKKFNNIPVVPFEKPSTYETGLMGDENTYEGDDQRFIVHRWKSQDEGHLPLYQFMAAKRMPHALDLREPEIAWEFLKHYSRNPDGSLSYNEKEN